MIELLNNQFRDSWINKNLVIKSISLCKNFRKYFILLLLDSVSCKIIVCPQLTILNSMDFNYFSIKVVVNVKLLDYYVILLWMLCRVELIGFHSITINRVNFLPIVRVCDLFNVNCIVLPGNGLRDRLESMCKVYFSASKLLSPSIAQPLSEYRNLTLSCFSILLIREFLWVWSMFLSSSNTSISTSWLITSFSSKEASFSLHLVWVQ